MRWRWSEGNNGEGDGARDGEGGYGGGGEGDDACLFSTYSEDDDVVDEIEGFLDDASSLLSTFEIWLFFEISS